MRDWNPSPPLISAQNTIPLIEFSHNGVGWILFTINCTRLVYSGTEQLHYAHCLCQTEYPKSMTWFCALIFDLWVILLLQPQDPRHFTQNFQLHKPDLESGAFTHYNPGALIMSATQLCNDSPVAWFTSLWKLCIVWTMIQITRAVQNPKSTIQTMVLS